MKSRGTDEIERTTEKRGPGDRSEGGLCEKGRERINGMRLMILNELIESVGGMVGW